MGKLKPSQHSSQSTTNSFRNGKLVLYAKRKQLLLIIDEPVVVPKGNRSVQFHKSTFTQQAKLGTDLQIGNMSEPISKGAKLRNFGLFGFCNRVQLKFAYIIHQYAHQNTPECTHNTPVCAPEYIRMHT